MKQVLQQHMLRLVKFTRRGGASNLHHILSSKISDRSFGRNPLSTPGVRWAASKGCRGLRPPSTNDINSLTAAFVVAPTPATHVQNDSFDTPRIHFTFLLWPKTFYLGWESFLICFIRVSLVLTVGLLFWCLFWIRMEMFYVIICLHCLHSHP